MTSNRVYRWSSLVALLGVFVAAAQPVPATAQSPTEEKTCALGMVQDRVPPEFQVASLELAAVPPGQVGVRYLGHSSFLIESPAGVTIVTDYNGVHVPAAVPDIVTMNRSHSSHYTLSPHPDIPFVLPGWDFERGIAEYDMRHKDVRIFNIPTNLVTFDENHQRNLNSIFVYQAASVCLAHLGHLHHYLTPEQQRQLRQVDILFVPIDGSSTMSPQEALHVIEQISPRLIIPMHYHFGGSAAAFSAMVPYPVREVGQRDIQLGKADLPDETEVWFLHGGGY